MSVVMSVSSFNLLNWIGELPGATVSSSDSESSMVFTSGVFPLLGILGAEPFVIRDTVAEYCVSTARSVKVVPSRPTSENMRAQLHMDPKYV
jgi:hypothetical protein